MTLPPFNLAGAECRIVRARKMACPESALGRNAGKPFPVLDNARITVVNGVIQDVGKASCHYDDASEIVDYGDVILLPGLANAHTHLQLSWLHPLLELNQGFVPWLRSLVPPLLKARSTAYANPEPEMLQALLSAFQNLVESGTALVGDIGASLRGAPSLINDLAEKNGIHVLHFCEWFGFGDDCAIPWPQECRDEMKNARFQENAAPAGHALYSTSAETLQKLKRWCALKKRIFSIHLAESEEESELLLNGEGALYEYYKDMVLPENWMPPKVRPLPLALKLQLLDEDSLAVHCVQVTDEDITLLASTGCSACLCPRSNSRLGAGQAPAQKLLDAGINVCLGTDGLTSNDDLDLRNEAEYLLGNQDISPFTLVRMMTVNGVKALGRNEREAMILPGNRAVFSAVRRDFLP